MKYIKLFEDIKVYTEIDINHFVTALESSDRFDDFTNAEVESILSISDDYTLREYAVTLARLSRLGRGDELQSIKSPKLSYKYLYSKTLNSSLHKMKDEWYYIYFGLSDSYYKCDQFDGLISCLVHCMKNNSTE